MENHISDDDNGIRLDRWFKRHLPNLNHALLQKALRKGVVKLGGKKAEASTRLEKGQVLLFPDEWKDMPKDERKKLAPKPEPVSESAIRELEKLILYEDKYVLVLNKPAGLAVQGGTGQKSSVDGILRARAQRRKEESPRLVHRLDRDTSGILVLGKSARDAAEIAGAFARKETQKYYWALIIGVPDITQGSIELPLAKKAVGKDSRTEGVDEDYEKVTEDADEGKYALTHYQVIDNAARKMAWVELQPVTGRTHQLRVHMEAIGHPIVGDGKYGGSEAFLEGEGIAKKLHLHARRIEFPLRGKKLAFEAPLTGHMKQSWKLFEFAEPRVKNR